MPSPFEKIAQIKTAQDLIDYAFGHSEVKGAPTSSSVPMMERVHRKENKRIDNVVEAISRKLKRNIEEYPNLDELPEFYKKLSHLLVNNDELRLNLGQLNGIIPVIERLSKQFKRDIIRSKNAQECAKLRTEFFGRTASIIRKQDSTFKFLEECRIKLMKVPYINLIMPSVVVAGYPNVGKSSIVGKISSSKPKVAEYPFTTRQIFLGIYEDKLKSQFFQVIDTPGILDRSMAERNEIEKQAILALNTIASVVLFIFDPTPSSGYEIESQIKLYHEIKDVFLAGNSIPLKIVVNKVDIATKDEIEFVVSQLKLPQEELIFTDASKGQNVELIVKYLLDYFKSTNYKR